MLERLNFLVVYVGSAAMAAFLAVCLTSPDLATYTCHAAGANGTKQCELAATMAAFAAVTGEMNPDALAAEIESISQEAAVAASAQ